MHDGESPVPDVEFACRERQYFKAMRSLTTSQSEEFISDMSPEHQLLLKCVHENMTWQELAETLDLPVRRVYRMYVQVMDALAASLSETQDAEPLNEEGTRPTSTAGVGRTERAIRTLSFLIPRQMREPFVGDLLEDLCQLRLGGAKRWWILATALSQILNALLQRPKIWLLGAGTWLAVTIRAWLLP